MEENPPHKNNSLSKFSNSSVSLDSDKCNDHDAKHCENGDQISEDVDQFINVLSAIDDKSSGLSEVPDFIDTFSKIVEARITGYTSGEINRKFGKMAEEDSFFMESVRRISKLTNALGEFPSDKSINSSLNQTSVALQRAMAFLEEEFRTLLEDSGNDLDHSENFHKFSSFNSKNQQDNSNRCVIQREMDSGESDAYPAYSPETVTKLREIATTMISAGYETECCQVYYISRRTAIRNQMIKLECEISLNMDEVAKMLWETMETEISRWINAVKTCSETIFPGEKRLGESIFSGYPQIHRKMLSNIMRIVVIQLLDFAEATSMAKRSAEKLFKYLDMYEALQNLIPVISVESHSDELMSEVAAAVDRIGDSASSIFCDLENSIESDAARTPVPGGAVHPLTRYVMNYLKYACEYKDTLEKIFGKQTDLNKKCIPITKDLTSQELEKESESPHNFEALDNMTPFSIQVVTAMDLLDTNLDRKSKLYKDLSLRYVFLMNNGRYILQKVKGSTEIRQVMGDTWCRRRSTVVRKYHKNYQRETWNRVLQCLNHDGLMVNGKVNKQLLKERFKIFTTIFEEIHRTQSTWVVSDEQLQSELRISISAVLIPAYRSFVGRFRQYLDSGKQADKYIKYQPEDVEALIEGLFEGNTTSMARRRT
ncbi:Exocyst component protein [Handroanthus impetiginosus]|uniref:Exocyst subunit Exo70 family protein n=1 Tax=Handroanthus impetiginosus TaxID=429701 RepID=A0A2G9HIQ2_9LAMI|nr:Exocyst component protein [Handroanthus impetiginosus]